MNILFIINDGFEEAETINPYDILVRAKYNVTISSNKIEAIGSHNVKLSNLKLLSETNFSDFDLVNRCIVINGKGQKQRYVPFTDFVFDLFNRLLKFYESVLNRKFIQWYENCKKIQEKKIAEYLENRYKISQARNNWQKLSKNLNLYNKNKDLFDLIKSEKETGKSNSDLRNEKLTALSLKTVDELKSYIAFLFDDLDKYLKDAPFNTCYIKEILDRMKNR